MGILVNGRSVLAAIVISTAILTVYEDLVVERSSAYAGLPTAQAVQDSKFRGSDSVTLAIRNNSKVLTRISVDSDEARQKAGKLGKIVQDYGRFMIVAKNPGVTADTVGLDEQTVETTVNLPGTSFDPLKQAPAGSLRLGPGTASNGKGYYVVQFGGTPTDEWLNDVGRLGIEILQYVPHQAYFVYGDGDAIARLADHSRVRWIGSYTPDQKLSKALVDQLRAARKGSRPERGISGIETSKGKTGVFDIAVFSRADLDNFVEEFRGRFSKGFLQASRLPNNYFNVVQAEVSLDDIEAIAELPDVVGIEAHQASRNEDERAAQILAGNYFEPTIIHGPGYNPMTQFGADGTNITVSVVDDGVGIPGDGGFYLTTLNTVNGPLRGTTAGASGHGHFNATLIAGSTPFGPLDGLFYNYGRGIAPRAGIVNIPRNRGGYSGSNADVYDDSISTPGPSGTNALISNNSWGSGVNGNTYGLLEAQFDGFVQDASAAGTVDPITLIFSAGNEGAVGLTQPKAAKNLIVVGNSESWRTDKGGASADNIDDLAVDSSRGPTADGRIKPDVVAPGTAVTGGRSGPNTLNGNIDSAHRWSSGTSHSAANITGVSAVFASWWYASNFNQRPFPSLIRAALINSALDMNGANAGATIPNGSEGWGRPNMKFMLNTGVGMKRMNEEVVFAETGHGSQITGSVADGSKPFRVTLAWTDPPGVSDPALVNNLDLTVTVGGVVYKGNVFSNGVSVGGGTADNKNNVENVFLPAGVPAGSAITVTITATALNGDGVLNNGDPTDQNFALVIYNYSADPGQSFHTVSGRVTSTNGRGIGMAKVRMTGAGGVVRETLTNHLGYYTFTNVAGGQSYIFNISAKRYIFDQKSESVTGNTSSLNFVATSGGP
ncbi:MAG: S8 family serine peptidase [Pyrinomonadaceae bacterium]